MLALEEVFGPQVLAPDRSLDRGKMRTLVFSDPSAKTRLEGIVHPLVGLEIARQTRLAEEAGSRCIVFDIPLLVESAHWRRNLHRVLVVDCTLETQIHRVVARNAMTPEEVQRIIATQASRSRRLRAADCVLFNDSITLDALECQVREICALFGL